MATPGPTTVSRRQCSSGTSICETITFATCRSGAHPPGAARHGEVSYAFADLAVIRQADAELAEGASFRAVLRNLLASRVGQLAFDFRIEAEPAKVLQLKRPEPPPLAALMDASPRTRTVVRRALLRRRVDARRRRPADTSTRRWSRTAARSRSIPYLVPALINLANIHYARDEIAEAQALYERAIALEPDVFEAHFNLGNIFHDLGRYAEAQALLPRCAAAEPDLRRRALLSGGDAGEERAVAGGAAALARLSAARAQRRVGASGEGILGLKLVAGSRSQALTVTPPISVRQ